MTEEEYRQHDEELLDEPDTFMVRVVNELWRIRKKHPPLADREQGFRVIMDEIRELERDIARAEGDRVIRHQLSQIAARCWRFERDLCPTTNTKTQPA